MANELKHGTVGTELTQAEWEAIGTHVVANQAVGDIIYASTTAQLRRLGVGSNTNVLTLAAGIPSWAAPAAAAAGSLTGSTLASGVTASSLTSVGTIATGVWQGTDVGVAYGGTGASSLTANGVLVGNGASAIGSIDMSTKGHVLIGDGSGNPQMLGVGTNTHVLTADSGETTGVKWAAPAAAAAGSLTGSTLASGVVTTSATTVGVLNSGSINTGFGNIDVGSSSLAGGSLDVSDGNITSVGSIDLDSITADGTDIAISSDAGGNITLGDGTTLIDVDGGLGAGHLGLLGVANANNGIYLSAAADTAVADATWSWMHLGGGSGVTVPSGTAGYVATLNLEEPNITSTGTTTVGTTFRILSAPSEGSTNYAMWVLAGTSRFDGDIDLNSTGTLLNVGASGNDWTAATLAHDSAVNGDKTVDISNGDNTSGHTSANAVLKMRVQANGGDPKVVYTTYGGTVYVHGNDHSEDRWVLSEGDTPGTDDCIRVTPARAITFSDAVNASYTTFDYVCDGCGKAAIEMFECCGVVAWHDDVLALRELQLSPEGLKHMAKLGIFEIDGPDDADPGWIGINYQKATKYTWAGMYQNRQRMDAQYDDLNKRLEAIGA